MKSLKNHGAYMNTTSKTHLMEETSEQFSLMKSPTVIYSLEDFHAQLFQLRESEQDSPQLIHEVLSFLKSAESLAVKESHMYSLKMLRDSSTTTEGEPLQLSSQVWMNWGMTSNGNVLTARISESHRTEKGCSLSEILEENPDPKYFLSESARQGMVERSQKNRDKGNGFQQLIYQRSTQIMVVGLGEDEQSSTKPPTPQMDMFEP
jgi:hypothetical protein